jgi:DNA topoisomerase-1
MDIKYTSKLEEDLDLIEEGDKTFLDVVESVYGVLKDHIKDAGGADKKEPTSTGEKCTKCDDGEIVERDGKFGKFYGCNKYPDCKTIYVKNEDGKFEIKKKKEAKKTGQKCFKCKGNVVERNGKHGVFYACDNYPKCKTIYVQDGDGDFQIQHKNKG